MNILVVTSEWPSSTKDIFGIQVVAQVRQLRRAGLGVTVLSFRGKKNPLRYLYAIVRLLCGGVGRYDVVHAHHGQAGLVALAQRCAPVVVTFHGSDLQGIRDKKGNITTMGRILKRVSHFVAGHAHEVILVSEHMSSCIPIRPYHVIPSGIDLDLFRPLDKRSCRRRLNLPLDKRLVLFVGDPERPEKQYPLGALIVNSVDRHMPVGLVAAHDVAHEKMPLYMNACDAMLVTSSSEGSPVAVREALACNLPIVSVDVGDVADHIASIDGCAVVRDYDPESIADALAANLTTNRPINGRARMERFDNGVLVKKVIEVYRKAAASHVSRENGEWM